MNEIAKGLGSDQLAEIADFIAALKSRQESRWDEQVEVSSELRQPLESRTTDESHRLRREMPEAWLLFRVMALSATPTTPMEHKSCKLAASPGI